MWRLRVGATGNKKVLMWSAFLRMRRRGVAVLLLVALTTPQQSSTLPSGPTSEVGSPRAMELRGGFSKGFPQDVSPRKLFPKETYGEGELELGNSFEQVLDTVCNSPLPEELGNSTVLGEGRDNSTAPDWNATLSTPSSPCSSSCQSRKFIMPPRNFREQMPKLVNGKVPRPWMGAGASAGTSPAKQQASNRFSAWIRESRAWIRSGINSITSPGYSAALQDASSRVSSWTRDSRAWFRSSFTLPASAGKNPPAAQQQAGPQFPGASQKASKRSPLPRFSDASGPGFALAGSMVRTIVKEGLSRSVASVVAGIFGATVTMVLLFTAAEMGVPMLMMDEGNMILQWFAAGGGFLASLVAGVCVAAVRPQYPVTHATVLGIFYTSARVANLLTRPGEEHPLWAVLQVACYIPGFYLSAVGFAQSPIECSCFDSSSPKRRMGLKASKAVSPESLVDALAAKKLARISLLIAVAVSVIWTLIPGP